MDRVPDVSAEDCGAQPSPGPYAEARIASRVSGNYLLRSLNLLNELGQGELLTSIVSLAIVQANVAHVNGASAPGVESGHEKPPPDVVRRPASVLSIAQTLGLPYETTRRHVMKLIQSGNCRRVGRGVIVPAEALDTDLNRAHLLRNLGNLRRMYRDLRAAGVDLD
jgi:hypothetical protein